MKLFFFQRIVFVVCFYGFDRYRMLRCVVKKYASSVSEVKTELNHFIILELWATCVGS